MRRRSGHGNEHSAAFRRKQPTPPGSIHVSPLPPGGFDPETASAADLAKYGIIPRPDPHSDLFPKWRRLFGAPGHLRGTGARSLTTLPPPNPTPDAALQDEPSPDIPQVPAAGAGSRFSHSENWSGGYIVPTNGTMAVQVAAEWTLPALSVPVVIDPSVQAYVCSTWVGLDGQRLYLNSSLPQIGVMQSLPGAGPSPLPPAVAFCQWWDRQGFQDPIIALTGLPVSEGNEVIGSVWVNTDTSVICHLRNVTTGELAVIGMDAPVVTLRGGTPNSTDRIRGYCGVGSQASLNSRKHRVLSVSSVWEDTIRRLGGGGAERGPAGGAARSGKVPAYTLCTDAPLDPARTAFVSMPHRKGNSVFELRYGGFKPQ